MCNLLSDLFTACGGCSQQTYAANIIFQAIDPDDCPIKGAVYRLTCACGKYLNTITNQRGYAAFCGVCPGTYTLTQSLAPYGYLPDGATHTVYVSNHCCVKIDGLPMRCFQSINQPNTIQPARSPAPVINPITPTTITITGTGSPGCKITVFFPSPDGCECTTCVHRNGTWSVDVPASEILLAGETIAATQTCQCMLPSDPVTQIVAAV